MKEPLGNFLRQIKLSHLNLQRPWQQFSFSLLQDFIDNNTLNSLQFKYKSNKGIFLTLKDA